MTVKDWLLNRAVHALLEWKSDPGAIRRTLSKLAYPRAAPPTRDRVRVAVVQMRMDLLEDGRGFALKYYRLVRQAVEAGAQLVVFPEYAWVPLLGLLPPVRELAESGASLESAVTELDPHGRLTIEEVFRTIAPAVKRIFQSTGSELARHMHVYLMPGSAIVGDIQGRLFNTAFLYGPDGALIGTQPKLHPAYLEIGWNWMGLGDRLAIFDLGFTRLAMPVCMDHTYWETTRIAMLHGAEIDLGFSAEAEAGEPYLAAMGVAARAQESLVYSTGAYCITDLFGLSFRGPSYIVGPIGASPGSSAFLAKAQTPDREEVIVADLDLARLREFRSSHPRDWNLGLYEKFLPKAYEPFCRRAVEK